jgi:hypothetical protein
MPLPPSAADWIRVQRLKSSANYGTRINLVTNADLNNVVTPGGCTNCSSRAGKRRDLDSVVGTGRTRREASKWTDFIAASRTDFITVTETLPNTGTRTLNRTVLCPVCRVSVLPTKIGPLPSFRNQHVRIN